MLSIDMCVGSVLSLIERTGKSQQVLGILPVLLVVRLHLLVEISGFATNNSLHCVDVGL